MNIGALWLIIYEHLKRKQSSEEISTGIWDDKSITILLTVFLVAAILLLLGMLYIVFAR